MEYVNDYSLLRPFTEADAKAGAVCCSPTGVDELEYIAGPDSRGKYILKVAGNSFCAGEFTMPCTINNLKLKPLCWLEGKPVYRGDSVYYSIGRLKGAKRVIIGYSESGGSIGKPCLFHAHGYSYIDELTWTPPTIKREGWMAIYESCSPHLIAGTSNLYETLDKLKEAVSCGTFIKVEWEEPADGQ